MKEFVKCLVLLGLFFFDVYSDEYSSFVRGCRDGTIVVSNVITHYNNALKETKEHIALNKKELLSLSETSDCFDGDEEDFYITELKLYTTRLQILSFEGMHKANFISRECLNQLDKAKLLVKEEDLFRQVEVDLDILKY